MDFTVSDISTGIIHLNETPRSKTAGDLTQSYIDKTLSMSKKLYKNTQRLLKTVIEESGKSVLWFPEDLHIKHHYDKDDSDAWFFVIGISVCNKTKLGTDLWNIILNDIKNGFLPERIGRTNDILVWQITSLDSYKKLMGRIKSGEDISRALNAIDGTDQYRQTIRSMCDYMELIPLLKDIVVSAFKTLES